MKSKNEKLLKEFSEFCKEHPELRFFQALSAWTRWSIYASEDNENFIDLFYIDKKKLFFRRYRQVKKGKSYVKRKS